MNKKQIEATRDVMSEINPLGLFDREGKMMVFTEVASCYLEAFKILVNEFQAGFIDIPYFMWKHQKIDMQTAVRKCCKREYSIIPLWERNSTTRDMLLRALLKVLLKATGLGIDDDAWKRSVWYFNTWLTIQEKKGIKPTEIDLKIV